VHQVTICSGSIMRKSRILLGALIEGLPRMRIYAQSALLRLHLNIPAYCIRRFVGCHKSAKVNLALLTALIASTANETNQLPGIVAFQGGV
jgi:hypothetical protein